MIQIGLAISPTAIAGGPVAVPSADPFAIAAWKAAFWASDPLWTPPAADASVNSWRDGGTEGKNATPKSGAGTGPLYRTSVAAFNNQPAIECNGTSQDLNTGNWASPIATGSDVTVVAIAKVGSTAATRLLWNDTGASVDTMWAGMDSTSYQMTRRNFGIIGSGPTNTNAHMWRGYWAATSGTCFIEIDGTSKGTGTAGSTAMNGLRMGAGYNGSETWWLGHFAFFGVKAGTLTAPELANFKAWATSFYGLTIA